MKTIYQYNNQRLFTGSTSQIDPSFGIIPVGWTDIEPPTIPENKVAFLQANRKGWVIIDPPVIPNPVPYDVSMAAARDALIDAGLIDAIYEAIATLPEETTRAKATVWWEYATRIHRDNQWVALLAPSLGLDDEAIDNLFRAAALIEKNS